MMSRKLYVGNLGHDVSGRDLEQPFADHGTVDNANVFTDRSTGQSKGFGFVEMNSEEQASTAIAALDGKNFSGRTIKVNEAKPRLAAAGKTAQEPGYGERTGDLAQRSFSCLL